MLRYLAGSIIPVFVHRLFKSGKLLLCYSKLFRIIRCILSAPTCK